MNRYRLSALFESLVCRWIAWPITTSTIVPKRALSQNGMRTRGLRAGPRWSTDPPVSIEAVAVGIAPERGWRSRLPVSLSILRATSSPASLEGNTGGMAKRVVVTGASSGIGDATAKLFRAHGWDVVGIARRADRLEALAAGHGIQTIVADVTDQADVDRVRDELAAGGPVHALINNAGGAFGSATVELSDPEDWRAMFDVNVLGTKRMISALLPLLRDGARGCRPRRHPEHHLGRGARGLRERRRATTPRSSPSTRSCGCCGSSSRGSRSGCSRWRRAW